MPAALLALVFGCSDALSYICHLEQTAAADQHLAVIIDRKIDHS